MLSGKRSGRLLVLDRRSTSRSFAGVNWVGERIFELWDWDCMVRGWRRVSTELSCDGEVFD